MAPRASTVKVALYCPSMSMDIADHRINLSHSNQVILEKIGGALETSRPCFAYDTKQQPISDFTQLKPSQTLLIATSYFERPLPEEKKDVKMVQPGPAEEKWMNLPSLLKGNVLRSLRKDDRRGNEAETIYLTLPFSRAAEKLKAITTSSSSPSSFRISESSSTAPSSIHQHLQTMQENWNAPIEAVLGFQGMVMPYGDMESWEEGLLAMLAVLSETTIGQPDVVATLIVEKVKERVGEPGRRGRGMVVETRDVREVGEGLFRRGLL